MDKMVTWGLAGLIVVGFMAVCGALFGWLVALIYNAILPPLFGWPTLEWWQAWGLVFLVGLVVRPMVTVKNK